MRLIIQRIGVLLSSLLLIYSCNGNYDFTKPIDGAASFLSGTLVLPIGQKQILISSIIQSLNISDLKQDENHIYYVRFDSASSTQIDILPLRIYPVNSSVEVYNFFRALVFSSGGYPEDLNSSINVPLYIAESTTIYDQNHTLVYEIDSRVEELHELLLADNTIMEVKSQMVGIYGGKTTGLMEFTLDFSDTQLFFTDGSSKLVYDVVAGSTSGQTGSKVVTKSLHSVVNRNPKAMGKLSFRVSFKTKSSDPATDPPFFATEIDPKVILGITISSGNKKLELKATHVTGRFDVRVDPTIGLIDVQDIFESYPEGNLLVKGAKLDVKVANPIDIPLKVDIDIASLDHYDLPIRSYTQIKDLAMAARYIDPTEVVVHYGEDVVNAMLADRKQMSKLIYTLEGVTDKEPTYLHRIDPNLSTYPFAINYSFYVPFFFKQGGYLQIDQSKDDILNDQVKGLIKGVESAYIYVDYQNWFPLDLQLTLVALDADGEQIGTLGSDLLIKAGTPNAAGWIDPDIADPILGGRSRVDQLEVALDNDKMQLLQQAVGIGYRLTMSPNANVDFAAISSKAKLDIRLSLKKGRGGFNVDLFGSEP